MDRLVSVLLQTQVYVRLLSSHYNTDTIGYVREYPTMQLLRLLMKIGMKANMILTECFWELRNKIELRERCCHALLIDIEKNHTHTERHSIATGSGLKQ